MKIPSENELDRIRREYPVGTIIELISMSDKLATFWLGGRRAAA